MLPMVERARWRAIGLAALVAGSELFSVILFDGRWFAGVWEISWARSTSPCLARPAGAAGCVGFVLRQAFVTRSAQATPASRSRFWRADRLVRLGYGLGGVLG
ncbi:MAG: hypothetical protein U0263_34945 [Polyangiaceae bacterium]